MSYYGMCVNEVYRLWWQYEYVGKTDVIYRVSQ